MDYSLTILNLLLLLTLVFLFIWFLRYAFRRNRVGGDAWEGVTILTLVFYSLAGILIDYLIQWLTSSTDLPNRIYFRNGIGLIILSGIYYLYRFLERRLTIRIPDEYKGSVGIVYNYPGRKKLKRNKLTLHSELNLPNNGIIVTNSKRRHNYLSFITTLNYKGEHIKVNSWREIDFKTDKGLINVTILDFSKKNNEVDHSKECEHKVIKTIKREMSILNDNHKP